MKKKHTKGRNKCTKNKMVSRRVKKETPNTHAKEQPTFSEILTWATLDRRQDRGRQTDARQRERQTIHTQGGDSQGRED